LLLISRARLAKTRKPFRSPLVSMLSTEMTFGASSAAALPAKPATKIREAPRSMDVALVRSLLFAPPPSPSFQIRAILPPLWTSGELRCVPFRIGDPGDLVGPSKGSRGCSLVGEIARALANQARFTAWYLRTAASCRPCVVGLDWP
jgi:hypothetical protein